MTKLFFSIVIAHIIYKTECSSDCIEKAMRIVVCYLKFLKQQRQRGRECL